MRWARGLIAVVGVAVAFVLTPGAYAQSVVATPGGPPQDLTMQLAADQTTGTVSFFLRNDGPTAIDGLGLAVVVYDADKHVLSSVATSFGKPGETQPTSTWQVPPQGVVQVVLTLSNLPALASFSGDVFGQRSGTPSQRLAGLNVSRMAKVILRGAPPSTSGNPPASGSPPPAQTLTLRSNSAAPRFELTLDNDSPVPATGVRVDVGSPVRGDGGAGTAASMTINTDNGQVPQTLDPHALHRLTLSATLPEQTDYAAWVDVHFDPNQLQRYAVQLSRVAAPNNVTIDDPKPAANELWFGVLGAQPADLVVTVRETGGVSTSVYRPNLVSLAQTGAGKSTAAQASSTQLEYQQADGTFTRGDDSATWNLDPHVVKTFRFRVNGLGPGTYTGQVLLTSPDGLALTKDISLSVKNGLPIAAIPTVAGVVLAYYVYRWTKGGRSQALRSLKIAQQREALRVAGFDANTTDPVGQALQRMLADLETQNQLNTLTDADLKTGLDDIQARLAAYKSALEMDRRLTAFVQQYGGVLQSDPSALAADWKEAYSHFCDLLQAQGKFDPNSATALADKYAQVRGQVLGELAQFLTGQLLELKQLPSAQDQGPVAQQLAAVQTAITNKNIEQAVASLQAAWQGVAKLAIAQLVSAIEETRRQLGALPAAGQQKVSHALDAAQAKVQVARDAVLPSAMIDQLALARHAYLGALLDQLDGLAAQLVGAGDAAGFTQALALARSEWTKGGDSPAPEQALQNAASEWSRYQDAWTAYLNLVTARLASQVQVFVTGTTAPPAGLTGIPWTEPPLQVAAASSVLTTLRPPPAGPPVTWASYMDARWQFARARLAVLGAAHAQIDTFLKSDAGQAGVWANDFTSFTTSLEQVQQPGGADTSPAALASFEAQLDQVWRDYIVFLTPPVAAAAAPPSSALESLVPDLSLRFMAAGAALPRLFGAPVQAAGLSVGKFSLAAADIGDVSGLPTRSVSGSLQLIQENDLLVGLVFIVIACLSGLTALWLTNASWGSFGDWTAAFMWAFGVSATTGTTFNALAANFGQASGA